MSSLSVCLIAKNEEANIARCLSSIEHIADEIIVVDTGSTDYTIKIAEGYSAKIISFPFDNNFAAARNESIRHATMDWVMYIDCDEQLDFDDSMRLKELLSLEKNEGICLSLINVIDGKKQLQLPSLRLFRNREEYRFTGKIHEQINPAIEKRNGKGSVFVSDIKLYHYGYDEAYADINTKIARNIEIFNSYDDEDKDGFFYYNLANEHLRTQNFKKALKYYLISHDYQDDNGYKLYLPIYTLKALHSLGDYQEAITRGLTYLEQYPNYPALHFILTACFNETGNKTKSMEHLIKYQEHSSCDYGYPNFNFESSNDINQLARELQAEIL